MFVSGVRNSRGESLVMVLVTVGIIGVIALVMASLLDNLLKGQNTLRSLGSVESAVTEAKLNLKQQRFCQKNLEKIVLKSDVVGTPIAKLRRLDSKGLLTPDVMMEVGGNVGGAIISDMALANVTQPGSDKAYYIANLIIKFRMGESTIGAKDLRPQTIPLQIIADKAGAIVTCSADPDFHLPSPNDPLKPKQKGGCVSTKPLTGGMRSGEVTLYLPEGFPTQHFCDGNPQPGWRLKYSLGNHNNNREVWRFDETEPPASPDGTWERQTWDGRKGCPVGRSCPRGGLRSNVYLECVNQQWVANDDFNPGSCEGAH